MNQSMLIEKKISEIQRKTARVRKGDKKTQVRQKIIFEVAISHCLSIITLNG